MIDEWDDYFDFNVPISEKIPSLSSSHQTLKVAIVLNENMRYNWRNGDKMCHTRMNLDERYIFLAFLQSMLEVK